MSRSAPLENRRKPCVAAQQRRSGHYASCRSIQGPGREYHAQDRPSSRVGDEQPVRASPAEESRCLRWRSQARSKYPLITIPVKSLTIPLCRQAMQSLRRKSRALMMFAGMLRYRMHSETYAQLTNLGMYTEPFSLIYI
jgi:hypothetical protein